MAHTKAQKAAKGNKDSIAKRLGVKIYGGQRVSLGNVIIRQRGTKYHPGDGTKIGGDDTIFAMTDGLVKFIIKHGKTYVTVQPAK
jgi:large subunit ribosomal protein L27